MRNVIFGVLLCALYVNGNNVIDALRQPHAISLIQELSGPATGPSGSTCNDKGVCENQLDGAMFPDSGSNGYIVCQCECGMAMPCPSGLVFNPVINVCDWPLDSTDAPGTSSSPTDITTKGTTSTSSLSSSSSTPSSTTSDITTEGTTSTPSSSSSSTPSATTSDITTEGTTSTPLSSSSSIPSSATSDITTECTTSTPSSSSPLTPSSTTSDITTEGTTSTPSSSSSSTPSSTNSDITTESTSTTLSGPATGPSGTTCNNKGVCENQLDGAMFPDSGSNGYIVCQCECGIAMPCPAGLVFNPVINVCDWPNST
ncbi:putative protein TPRXL [Bactrocera tryoni]|uniref:putative protein TPRXL n=1 Tax=Bactrocera tryoni TaxID=59916 RepID=UPI001A99B04E|nr:putative protein TPRXL [Bactrocera tryoni]